ncbi:MAG: hypothetical protein P8Y95_01920 [Gammaproteobacteria bacterium]|jgi:hypothetical protein
MSVRALVGGALQVLFYAVFGTVIVYFSVSPTYRYLAPGYGMLKVSFSHTGPRRVECPDFTPQEIAKRPPSERFTMSCPRARLPLLLELDLDGELLYRAELEPAGIADDGASSVYEKFPLRSGRHALVARMRDTKRTEGFDHVARVEFEIEPERNFVVDFRPETGGFVFRPQPERGVR